MNTLDLNTIFHRNDTAEKIKHILSQFDANCRDIDFKKGIYIYGAPGTGKTHFVLDLLKQMNYDVVKYDAGDVRNKALIDSITCDNVSRHNVLDMMHGRVRKIAILMDEIDGMHKGDKGGISALVKLIRQKKTKKQKSEHITLNPVICIGNYYMDKKIKELMKVCNVFELPTPANGQIDHLFHTLMPKIEDPVLREQMIHYAQGDLRKVEFLHRLYEKKPEILTSDNIQHIFHAKFYNEDYGKIAKQLFDTRLSMDQHADFMNDNDRTTVALLWHENAPDRIGVLPPELRLPFYLKLVDNICFADYIDRITFQSQIWVFNEMSTFIKTFYNNYLFHSFFEKRPPEEMAAIQKMNDVRFTKILTKYSTEYSNQQFLYMLCQELEMEKKDIVALFQELRLCFGQDFMNKTELLNEAEKIFVDTKIGKLDIKRGYRYLDKNVKKETAASKKRAAEEKDGEDDIDGILDYDDDDDDGA
jgi:SpoVK/Ycf46/Vps4 family AAA+-type ATPase